MGSLADHHHHHWHHSRCKIISCFTLYSHIILLFKMHVEEWCNSAHSCLDQKSLGNCGAPSRSRR